MSKCVEPRYIRIMLIAEEDSLLQELLAVADLDLVSEFHSSPVAAAERCLTFRPEVILLSLDKFQSKEFDLAATLDARCGAAQVVFGEADDEDSRMECFERGAVDYVVAPLSTRELVLRIQRHVSRLRPDWHSVRVGPLRIDRHLRVAWVEGREVPLTDTEYRLLDALFAEPGTPTCRHKLMGALQKEAANIRTVDVQVSRLRSKLRNCTDQVQISSVRNQGYALRISN